jgi:hypothetical protein
MKPSKLYAIIRQEKVKSFGQLKARSEHNTRKQKGGLEHTSGRDDQWHLLLGKEDALEAWKERAEAVGFDPSKMRKNAVPAVEFLATASADWWAVATPEMKADWQAKSLAFIAEKMGGEENILQAVLHMDETTPHLQVLTAPFIEKEMKARGRGSAGKPPRKAWALSATDYIGGHRSEMEQMQTDYAKSVETLGMRRGVPRKETGARNLRPSRWRALMATELDDTMAYKQEADRDRTEARKARMAAQAALDKANAYLRRAQQRWHETRAASRAMVERWSSWEPKAVEEAKKAIQATGPQPTPTPPVQPPGKPEAHMGGLATPKPSTPAKKRRSRDDDQR